ncbi:MAG: hypothetical protein R2684_05610 [Pyrinomonadaceae bacterium]
MKNIFAIITVFVLAVVAFGQQLPDIGIQTNMALGEVKSVGAEKLRLSTKDGEIDVVYQSITQFKRLPPDNLKLSAATDSALSDISVGDRLLVTGKVSENKNSIYANKIFLVKGEDLAQQAERQRREWTMRGVAGRVESIDSAGGIILVKVSSLVGSSNVVKVVRGEGTVFKRYSETSAAYADATLGKFEDISAGDTIQAKGDKSADGLTLAAEEVLSGSFVTFAGEIKSVDAEKNQVVIADIASKKDVTVSFAKVSLMKKFPEEIATRMAMFQAMSRSGSLPAPPSGGGQSPQGDGQRPQGGGRGDGSGQGRGMAGGDINQMLNRFPTITVADLNKGEYIAISSSKPKDGSAISAIRVLAGIEPFLRAPSTGGGRGGIQGGLSIPGLDSVDF